MSEKKSKLIQSDNSRLIEADQLTVMCKHIPMGILLAPASAILFIALQQEYSTPSIYIPWLIAVFICNGVFGVYIFRIYKRFKSSNTYPENMMTLCVIYATLTGFVWGAAGVLFFPSEARDYQMLTTGWLWALASMLSIPTVSIKKLFYILAPLLLLPLIVNTMLEGSMFHTILGISTLMYLGCLFYMYHANHHTFIDAIYLKYENMELINKLINKNYEAEEATKKTSRFLAAASHDLRQPVHAQSLYISELDEYVIDPTGRRVLAGLENTVDAMRRLFDSVLDIAKLDAGIITPQISHFSVEKLFEELKYDVEPVCNEKNLTIHFVSCSAIINTDRILLRRSLRNLLSNAIRYTDKGHITIGCRRQSDSIRIEVWDTGIGIDQIDKHKIFEEFYQCNNPERDRDRGLGLGLSITSRISTILNHNLEMKSTPGKGSCFSINVPTSKQKTQTTKSKITINNKKIVGLKILVIEDDGQVRSALTGLLQHWKCLVIAVSSGDDAISQLQKNSQSLNLIISDYRLRNKETGLEAIKKVRAQQCNPALAAIIITGDTSPERIQEVYLSGMVILHKPVQAAELKSSIHFTSNKQVQTSGNVTSLSSIIDL